MLQAIGCGLLAYLLLSLVTTLFFLFLFQLFKTSLKISDQKQVWEQPKKNLSDMNQDSNCFSILWGYSPDTQADCSLANRLETNIHTIIIAVRDMLYLTKKYKRLSISIDIPSDFPNILMRENQVIDLFMQLFHCIYTVNKSDRVLIKVRALDQMATIYIIDKRNTVSKQKSIFPIGMKQRVLLKQLIKLYGGRINKGAMQEKCTIVAFQLPLAIKEDKNETEEDFTLLKNDTSSNQKPIVVIVDNHPENVYTLLKLLTVDYRLLTAMNETEALKLIDHNEVDLVIATTMLPNLSGYQLTQLIRKHHTFFQLPVLLLPPRNKLIDIQAVFRSGANDYILKQMDPLEIKSRIRSLIYISKMQKQLLQTEAALLQAKIQPHFLFNTLNMIASLGEINQEKMIRVIEEFSFFLRRSFNDINENSMIYLHEELEFTKSYLYIQKERYGPRIDVRWEVDEHLQIKIPPIVIQTLVENALQHGILSLEKGGNVVIRTTEFAEYVIISVYDDGIGMKQSTYEKLLTNSPGENSGIGIANTHQRLLRLFGKGLNITSRPNQGTFISFQIPKL